MTTHARPGDSMSAAKLTLYGSIGTALIGAVSAIIVQMVNHDNVSTGSNGSPPTNITPTARQVSDRGSAVISGTGDVTVSGSAQQDVNGMFVLIGPRPSGGYWVGYANVVNQHWQANVATEPPWQNYTIEAYPYFGPSGGATPGAPPTPPVPKATSEPAVLAVAPAGRLVSETTSQSALKFAFQPEPTPPPPPPPDQIVDCAAQFGPKCFTGPGFGPPSVYQPKQ